MPTHVRVLPTLQKDHAALPSLLRIATRRQNARRTRVSAAIEDTPSQST
jgi:hypothetical protein